MSEMVPYEVWDENRSVTTCNRTGGAYSVFKYVAKHPVYVLHPSIHTVQSFRRSKTLFATLGNKRLSTKHPKSPSGRPHPRRVVVQWSVWMSYILSIITYNVVLEERRWWLPVDPLTCVSTQTVVSEELASVDCRRCY